MNLSSTSFIFGAFPIFLLLYFFSKPKFRIYELLVFSAWFYYVNDPAGIKYLAIIIVVNYIVAFSMSRNKGKLRKSLLVAGIMGNVSVLYVYKYLAFSVAIINFIAHTQIQAKETTMLVGLSFFTFALISFLVDVYRQDISVPANPIKFASYILMFPKILMGPIARFSEAESGFDKNSIEMEDVGAGAKRFLEGLFKKVIIADNLAVLVSLINSSNDYANMTVTSLWIGSIAYSLQLYFDFSGYSDMAIGIAKILGYNFKDNFNYPYCCKSFTDFWRRWHISLSEWFRDYIYIPLGGSRKSLIRNIFNLLVVWLLTGIWHGAGSAFIAWGLIYFIMLLIERYIIKPKNLNSFCSVLWRIVTLLVINFNWVLFSHKGVMNGIRYCLGMSGIVYHNSLFSDIDVLYLREYGLYLILGIAFSLPIGKVLSEKMNSKDGRGALKIIIPILYILIFIWALSFMMLGFHNPFMYQNF